MQPEDTVLSLKETKVLSGVQSDSFLPRIWKFKRCQSAKNSEKKYTSEQRKKTHYTLHLFKGKKNLLLTSGMINKGAIGYHIIKGTGMGTG